MKNTMIATSVSISKRMIEAGFDARTADMRYIHMECVDDIGYSAHVWLLEPKDICVEDEDVIETVPSWSLTSLIELLPYEIKVVELDTNLGKSYYLNLGKSPDDYYVQYVNDLNIPITYLRFTGHELVCCVWIMLMELKEKGLI